MTEIVDLAKVKVTTNGDGTLKDIKYINRVFDNRLTKLGLDKFNYKKCYEVYYASEDQHFIPIETIGFIDDMGNAVKTIDHERIVYFSSDERKKIFDFKKKEFIERNQSLSSSSDNLFPFEKFIPVSKLTIQKTYNDHFTDLYKKLYNEDLDVKKVIGKHTNIIQYLDKFTSESDEVIKDDKKLLTYARMMVVIKKLSYSNRI